MASEEWKIVSINKACKILGYSKQAYFKAKKNAERKSQALKKAEDFIIENVKMIRKDMAKIGSIKLYFLIKPLLDEQNIEIGRDRFIRILKSHKLLNIRKKRRYITTDSSDWRNQYSNLIEETIPTRPEQIWVADITYIETQREGAVYGHLITDAYSKQIMGYEISKDMKASSTLKALKMAIKKRQYNEELIHHSDRGTQYCSSSYTRYLKKHKIQISMTQDGNPYDNAVAERINGILKEEFGLGGVLKDLQEAKSIAAQSVEIYNTQRPHWSIGFYTPDAFHQQQEIKIRTEIVQNFVSRRKNHQELVSD